MIEVKAYKCDYCGRLFKNRFTLTHEKFCKQNPNNRHKCFEYCKFLIKTEELVGYYNDEYPIYKTVFTCTKNDIKLYSFLAEKRKLNIQELTRMPLECSDFDSFPNILD